MDDYMYVLGIETSCDETACAVVRNGKEILSSIISSQYDLHQSLGGVVPELACRRHVDVLLPIIDEAILKAGITLSHIDLIAVTHRPGLIGALLIGVHAAKALSLALNKPLIGVNHIEAHLYAALMSSSASPSFPALGVVLSGGHTALILMRGPGIFHLLSSTVDDAIGEAFDKTAKILNRPYPGGPEIEKMAKQGNSMRYPFRAGTLKERALDFSFSGLKTAVLYALQKVKKEGELSSEDACDIAASFQRAAFQDIIHKTLIAAQEYGCRDLIFGGGVTHSKTLRDLFAAAAHSFSLHWPEQGLSLDNGAMIAGLGYYNYFHCGIRSSLELEASSQKIR
jgi:N6-L-threonylcarbamoyladenine synthase